METFDNLKKEYFEREEKLLLDLGKYGAVALKLVKSALLKENGTVILPHESYQGISIAFTKDGKYINEYATKIFIEDNIIFVETESSVILFELLSLNEKILLINALLGLI